MYAACSGIGASWFGFGELQRRRTIPRLRYDTAAGEIAGDSYDTYSTTAEAEARRHMTRGGNI